MKLTQCEKVLEYIKQFGSITTFDAFNEIGITRLGSRICDLRQKGYQIADRTETRKNRFGEKVHFKRYYFNEERL